MQEGNEIEEKLGEENIDARRKLAVEQENMAEILILAKNPLGFSALFFHALELQKKTVLVALKDKYFGDFALFLRTFHEEKTPVMKAAQCGCLESLIWLSESQWRFRVTLSFNEYLNAQDSTGKNAFLLAAEHGHSEVIDWIAKRLAKNFNLYAVDNENNTAMHLALANTGLIVSDAISTLSNLAQRDNRELFASLRDVNSRTVTQVAAGRASKETFAWLLKLAESKGKWFISLERDYLGSSNLLVQYDRADLILDFIHFLKKFPQFDSSTEYYLNQAISMRKEAVALCLAEPYFQIEDCLPILISYCAKAEYLIPLFKQYHPQPLSEDFWTNEGVTVAEAIMIGLLDLDQPESPIWEKQRPFADEEKAIPNPAFDSLVSQQKRDIQCLLYILWFQSTERYEAGVLDNKINPSQLSELKRNCVCNLQFHIDSLPLPWGDTALKYFQDYYSRIPHDKRPVIDAEVSQVLSWAIIHGDESVRKWVRDHCGKLTETTLRELMETIIRDTLTDSITLRNNVAYLVENYFSTVSLQWILKYFRAWIAIRENASIAEVILGALIDKLRQEPDGYPHIETIKQNLSPAQLPLPIMSCLQKVLIEKSTSLIKTDHQALSVCIDKEKQAELSKQNTQFIKALISCIDGYQQPQFYENAGYFYKKIEEYALSIDWFNALEKCPGHEHVARRYKAELIMEGHYQEEWLPLDQLVAAEISSGHGGLEEKESNNSMPREVLLARAIQTFFYLWRHQVENPTANVLMARCLFIFKCESDSNMSGDFFFAKLVDVVGCLSTYLLPGSDSLKMFETYYYAMPKCHRPNLEEAFFAALKSPSIPHQEAKQSVSEQAATCASSSRGALEDKRAQLMAAFSELMASNPNEMQMQQALNSIQACRHVSSEGQASVERSDDGGQVPAASREQRRHSGSSSAGFWSSSVNGVGQSSQLSSSVEMEPT